MDKQITITSILSIAAVGVAISMFAVPSCATMMTEIEANKQAKIEACIFNSEYTAHECSCLYDWNGMKCHE